jgi:hypothetical protein
MLRAIARFSIPEPHFEMSGITTRVGGLRLHARDVGRRCKAIDFSLRKTTRRANHFAPKNFPVQPLR